MKDGIWKKINYLVGLLPLGALFGLVSFAANVEIKDLDLWLHLAMGKFITSHHYIPDVDILSCTIAGTPWINHEWLFQVIVYQIFHLWGPDGLLKMQTVIVLVTMLLLLLLGYTKDKQLVTTFILLLVYLVFQQRFTIRPDIFSLLFFTVYIYILALHVDKKWAAAVLLAVQILWTNTHGFFFFGPLFVLIGLFSEGIKRHVPLPFEWNVSGRLTDNEYRRLKGIFVLVLLACLVNPSLVRGAVYPIGVFFSLSSENKVFFEYIQELQKPVTWDTLWDAGRFGYYKLLIVLSLASFILNRRRIDISAFFFWLVFLVFSLKASRNTSFFAFAAYLVIITNMATMSFKHIIPLRFTARKFQYVTSIVFKMLLLFWMFQYCSGMAGLTYYDLETYARKSEFGGISLKSYPVKAVNFLVDNHVKANIFNDFNSGAYLLGRAFPDIKVFIDGRTEAYGGKFFKQYQKILKEGDTRLFEEAVDKYHLTAVLFNAVVEKAPQDLMKYLYHHQDWRLVYFNYDALIFLRRVPEHEALIGKYALDLSQWQPPQVDLLKIAEARVSPYPYYKRGCSLEALDFDEAALAEAREANRIAPDHPDPYELMGRIRAKQKDYKKAFENFRVAASLSPGSKKLRYNLALSYSDMGETQGAVEQYRKMTEQWPREVRAFYLLSKAFFQNRQYEESLKTLRKAVEMDPDAVQDILKIGDMMLEAKEFVKAKEIYTLALGADKNLAAVHSKLGACFLAIEDPRSAREQFEKALSIDSEYKEAREELKKLNEKY